MGRINVKKLADDMEFLAAEFRRLDEQKIEIQRQIVLMHERVKKLENHQAIPRQIPNGGKEGQS